VRVRVRVRACFYIATAHKLGPFVTRNLAAPLLASAGVLAYTRTFVRHRQSYCCGVYVQVGQMENEYCVFDMDDRGYKAGERRIIPCACVLLLLVCRLAR
jgi:hypothetical protein